jgi:hypothetical protein
MTGITVTNGGSILATDEEGKDASVTPPGAVESKDEPDVSGGGSVPESNAQVYWRDGKSYAGSGTVRIMYWGEGDDNELREVFNGKPSEQGTNEPLSADDLLKEATSGGDNTGGNGSGSGDVPSGLVGVWYRDVNSNGTLDTGEDVIAAYEFRRDGKLLVAGQDIGATFSVSGDQITMTTSGVSATASIAFTISGNSLTLSGSTASGFMAGNYAKK